MKRWHHKQRFRRRTRPIDTAAIDEMVRQLLYVDPSDVERMQEIVQRVGEQALKEHKR